jgi:hypothetical protein
MWLEEGCVKTLKSISVLAILPVLFTGTLTHAGDQDSTGTAPRVVPEIRAYRVNPHAPVIDGNLDDPVWTSPNIQKIGGFTQTDPDEGKPPTESTLVAIAYDDKAVYVAFWCYDSEPDNVSQQLVRRDRWSQSDQASIRLDPYHDHQTGYMFTVSAAGTQRDQRIYNNDWTDLNWDAVWMSAVEKQSWGWSAEMEIPYHCLRFSEQAEHVWGVDFVRVVARKNEWDQWAFVPSKEGGMASNFGHLTGLSGIKPAQHFEVLPYAVTSAETRPASRWDDGRDVFGNTGVDLKYGISSNLTLDATINPDFGQVELDQPVLNLSTYETQFSEKRPFFMEGADLFETNFSLFYSRRIGRAPAFSPTNPDVYEEINPPGASTILGAAKLTGKIAGRTSIALLTSVTDQEKTKYAAIDSVYNVIYDADSNIVDADTAFSFHHGVVEPQAGYAVVRIKRELFDRSSVGGMLTLASQDTRYPAMTGGCDWRLHTNNGRWYTNGQTIFSRVDPTYTGFGLAMGVGKGAGEHTRGEVSVVIKDPHLQINRLGYTSRNNTRNVSAWVQYRTTKDWWIVRNSWNNLNYYYSQNYQGVEFTKGGNFNTYIEFTNNWSLGGGVEMQAEKYSDDETRGRGLWEWPVVPTYSWWASLSTDPRKMITLNLNPGSGGDRGGSWWANYIGVDFRPRSNMEFSLGTNYFRNFRNTRWVTNPDDTTTIFADLDKDQISLSASASVMLNRNLSCQLSAEGLISGLDYRNYRPYLGHNQYGPVQTDYNYDFNWGALNSTFLIRWEYRPGSTIFVVWTRAKSDWDPNKNDLDFSRDFRRFFSTGSENLFLVKASYWLNI